MTAQNPGSVPDAAAPPNTFSYIAIACGILAFVISWLIFGVLGVVLGFVARGRRELRWKTGLGAAASGTEPGFCAVTRPTYPTAPKGWSTAGQRTGVRTTTGISRSVLVW